MMQRAKVTSLFMKKQVEELQRDRRECVIVTHETGLADHNLLRSFERGSTSPTGAHSTKDRFNKISFDHFITMECGDDSDKLQIFEQCLKAMIKNKWG